MSLNTKLGYHEACIRAHAMNGATAQQLADATGASVSGIHAFCKRWGIELTKLPAEARSAKPGRPRKDYAADPRVQKMAEMYRQGVTLQAIGDQFNISRQAVEQKLKRVGIDRTQGGQHVAMTLRRPMLDKKAQRRAVIEAAWGVPFDLYTELRALGAVLAFQHQAKSAKNRGIQWRLTFSQWWAIWQASGKFHLRGRGLGKYCMSRIRDGGAYELGNVHVQLAAENSREAVAKWLGKEKPIRGVYCLYPGRDLAWLAKYGRVSIGYFRTAEEAGAARDAYMAAAQKKPAGLGRGRGWTLVKKSKARPYLVQVAGTKSTYHATQAEAEAEYARRCAEVAAKRAPTAPTPETVKG